MLSIALVRIPVLFPIFEQITEAQDPHSIDLMILDSPPGSPEELGWEMVPDVNIQGSPY